MVSLVKSKPEEGPLCSELSQEAYEKKRKFPTDCRGPSEASALGLSRWTGRPRSTREVRRLISFRVLGLTT